MANKPSLKPLQGPTVTPEDFKPCIVTTYDPTVKTGNPLSARATYPLPLPLTYYRDIIIPWAIIALRLPYSPSKIYAAGDGGFITLYDDKTNRRIATIRAIKE